MTELQATGHATPGVESVESMDISELVSPSTVAVRAGVTTKRQLMNILAELASPAVGASEKVLVEGLLEREALGSTGLSGGAAVPHARSPEISKVSGVFVKLEQPLEFDAHGHGRRRVEFLRAIDPRREALLTARRRDERQRHRRSTRRLFSRQLDRATEPEHAERIELGRARRQRHQVPPGSGLHAADLLLQVLHHRSTALLVS